MLCACHIRPKIADLNFEKTENKTHHNHNPRPFDRANLPARNGHQQATKEHERIESAHIPRKSPTYIRLRKSMNGTRDPCVELSSYPPWE